MNKEPVAYFESTDEVFKLLADVSVYHVSARKKHYELLNLLKLKGVAFNDTRKYLLNRAAEVGLWERGMRESECSKRAWYVTMQNFVAWQRRNFSDYGVIMGVKTVKSAGENRKLLKTIKTRKLDKDGNIVEQKIVETSKTLRETVEEAKAKAKAKATKEATVFNKEATEPINRPVIETLTSIQISQIVFQHIDILAERAESLGAGKEWNALMTKMGLMDELLDLDSEEVTEEMLPVTDTPEAVVSAN